MTARFTTGIRTKKQSFVSKRTVAYLLECIFSDDAKEQTPHTEVCEVSGRHLVSLYLDPIPGMVISWMGHDWQVIEIRVHATKRGSRDKKYVPIIVTEYAGRTPDSYFNDNAATSRQDEAQAT